MLCLRLAAGLLGAVFLAGCMQTMQGPTAIASNPQGANYVMYGSAEPVRTPNVSFARPRENKDAAATPQVRAAELNARRAKQMSDAPPPAAETADVVYSEKWYAREQATEDRLSQSTKICRGC